MCPLYTLKKGAARISPSSAVTPVKTGTPLAKSPTDTDSEKDLRIEGCSTKLQDVVTASNQGVPKSFKSCQHNRDLKLGSPGGNGSRSNG